MRNVCLIRILSAEALKRDGLRRLGKIGCHHRFIPFKLHRRVDAAALSAKGEQQLCFGDRRAADGKSERIGIGAEIGDVAVFRDPALIGAVRRIGARTGLRHGHGDARIPGVFQKRLDISAEIIVHAAHGMQAASAVQPRLRRVKPLRILLGD